MSLWTVVGRFNRRVWLRTRWGVLTGRSLLNLALIVVGAALTAVSVVVFLNPNDVAPGGFTAPSCWSTGAACASPHHCWRWMQPCWRWRPFSSAWSQRSMR